MKSYMTTVTRYMSFVFESRSIYMSSNLPINHSTCTYALIEITIFNPSASHLEARKRPLDSFKA
jgi:hypothetical protein